MAEASSSSSGASSAPAAPSAAAAAPAAAAPTAAATAAAATAAPVASSSQTKTAQKTWELTNNIMEVKVPLFFSLMLRTFMRFVKSVLRVREILVRIRLRILLFSLVTFKMLIILKLHLHNFSKIKSHKEVTKQ
jgi:hypothetical protein